MCLLSEHCFQSYTFLTLLTKNGLIYNSFAISWYSKQLTQSEVNCVIYWFNHRSFSYWSNMMTPITIMIQTKQHITTNKSFEWINNSIILHTDVTLHTALLFTLKQNVIGSLFFVNMCKVTGNKESPNVILSNNIFIQYFFNSILLRYVV